MKQTRQTAGRPRKIKTIVIEWLAIYWLGTLLGGLGWLWLGGGMPALAMLAISGLLWWLGSLVDLWWP